MRSSNGSIEYFKDRRYNKKKFINLSDNKEVQTCVIVVETT